MAGQGKKTFVAGEVLTAQDVNGYLMDQSVMNFASAAARSSAIPTPSDGMLALTKDDDLISYYKGPNWVPALPIGAWQSWAPTLSGGWANGNGTWSAAYVQIGKTVHVRGSFTLGSTTTKGTGVDLSLPVTATATGFPVGTARLNAVGVNYVGHIQMLNTTTLRFFSMSTAAATASWATITATSPATWATGNTILFMATYEAA